MKFRAAIEKRTVMAVKSSCGCPYFNTNIKLAHVGRNRLNTLAKGNKADSRLQLTSSGGLSLFHQLSFL